MMSGFIVDDCSDTQKNIIKDFLESKPLYVRKKLSNDFVYIEPDVLILFCNFCKSERPFRNKKPVGHTSDPKPYQGKLNTGIPVPFQPTVQKSEIYEVKYECTGCGKEQFRCWFEISDGEEKGIRKIGQFPMWFPKVSKELKEAFGDDVELYQKALRNMNEGYGIGACAYLRRLVEKYINPLLELLHDVKQEQGESQENLNEIKEVIKAKDFTSKTRYAAEIAPSSIIVQGHNPLKEIHERLSIGLHSLDDDKAIEYATAIKDALEFIIPRLRQEFNERKAYAEKLKQIRNLPTT